MRGSDVGGGVRECSNLHVACMNSPSVSSPLGVAPTNTPFRQPPPPQQTRHNPTANWNNIRAFLLLFARAARRRCDRCPPHGRHVPLTRPGFAAVRFFPALVCPNSSTTRTTKSAVLGDTDPHTSVGESTRTKLSPRTALATSRVWRRVWLSDAMQMAVARSTCTCG